jgi:hypothetical protein
MKLEMYGEKFVWFCHLLKLEVYPRTILMVLKIKGAEARNVSENIAEITTVRDYVDESASICCDSE